MNAQIQTSLKLEKLSPAIGAIVHGVDMGRPVGGDTLFADMEAAYDNLSQPLKDSLEGKTALHDFAHFRLRFQKEGKQKELAELERRYPNPEHPVLRTHPDTGRKSIYVNIGFTRHIVGMKRDESEKLLKYLYSRASIPEYQCRFKWRKNSVAFWDNRSCQHYATSDYWPAVRQMERETVVGSKPA